MSEDQNQWYLCANHVPRGTYLPQTIPTTLVQFEGLVEKTIKHLIKKNIRDIGNRLGQHTRSRQSLIDRDYYSFGTEKKILSSAIELFVNKEKQKDLKTS